MNLALAQELISANEGRRMQVYLDTLGNRSIGIGFNLSDEEARNICQMFDLDYDTLCAGTPMTETQVDEVFAYQSGRAAAHATAIVVGLKELPETYQAVTVDMVFNMGPLRFAGFKKLIQALNAGRLKDVPVEMLDSLWAKQVPNRAANDVKFLTSGVVA